MIDGRLEGGQEGINPKPGKRKNIFTEYTEKLVKTQ